MKNLLTWTLFCCGLAALLADAPPKVEKPEPIAAPREGKDDVPPPQDGYYSCTGAVNGNDGYESMVMVKRASPHAFIVTWAGGYTGVGVMEGSKFFVASHNADTVIVLVFSRTETKDGVVWQGKQLTAPGDGKFGNENLTFLRPFKQKK